MPPSGRGEPLLRDPAVRSVLLVRLRVGLGDLLCTVPALRALRTARPDLHVALTTWAETGPVLDRFAAHLDELVPFPGVAGIPERSPDGAFAQWAARQRARRYDLALQLYGDNAVANDVTRAVGARDVGGFLPPGASGDLRTHVPYPGTRHEVDRQLLVLEHLGLPPGADRSLEWPVRPEDESEADAVAPAGPFVVLHPGATSASRRWPAVRFAEVGDALARDGLQVVVGGVEAEREHTGAVMAALRAPAVDLTGRTGLGGYAVLLRRAAVVVTNDTGTAHLTAAVGGHAVTVFLSGDPVRWRHAAELQTVVREDVGCNPCRHLTCPIDFRCALGIEPAHVLSAARAALARSGRPSAAR